MASTNVMRNFPLTQIGATTVTSIRNIVPSDQTTLLQDGSDDDVDFTFTIEGAKKTQVTVTLRDPEQAYVLANSATAAFKWQEENASVPADNFEFTITNVKFKQPSHNGQWGELREYTVVGEGGQISSVKL
jgi:hypothetical protein